MSGSRLTRCFFIALLGLALTSCGFRLAGSSVLPPQLSQIYLVTSDISERQRNALSKRLERAGAKVSGQPLAQSVQLSVRLKVLPDRRQVTSASNGTTVETLARSLTYGLRDADGQILLPAKTLTQQKNIVFDDDNLLSSTAEKSSVVVDIEAALFNQLIHQLNRI